MSKHNQVMSKVIFGLCVGFPLLIQGFLVTKTIYFPIADKGYVDIQSQNLARGEMQWMQYFKDHPNNVNVAIFWSTVYKIFNLFSIKNPLVLSYFL